jgi:hypothetical protein
MARRERLGYEMITAIVLTLIVCCCIFGAVATYYILAYKELSKSWNIIKAEQLQAELENNLMKARINNLINELQNKNKISDAIKNRRDRMRGR